ncbi:MAG: hypothetical protein NG784_14120 [Candidatus Jettenia sp.]|nr:hypothetical protein [Candidatus Jettenia sp.]
MKPFVKPVIFLSLLFSIIVSFSRISGAEDEKWKYYATSKDNTKHYYDVKSITYTSDNLVRVWDKTIVSENSNSLTREMRMLREIDCSKRRYRSLEMRVEYIDGSEKEKVYSRPEWIPITSNTWMESLCEIVCKKK